MFDLNMQALQQFLTLDTDSLLHDPQWKRVEEEECVFHSISVLRRTTISAVPPDGLSSVPSSQTSSTSTSATITKLGSSLMSGMSYLTGKVCNTTAPEWCGAWTSMAAASRLTTIPASVFFPNLSISNFQCPYGVSSLDALLGMHSSVSGSVQFRFV